MRRSKSSMVTFAFVRRLTQKHPYLPNSRVASANYLRYTEQKKSSRNRNPKEAQA
jgi:hypothetical protein